MLEHLTEYALKRRLLVFLGALCLAAGGLTLISGCPSTSFSDVAPVQARPSSHSPSSHSRRIGSARDGPDRDRGPWRSESRADVLSTTRYALLAFEFAEGVDIYWVCARVNERLSQVADQFLPGASGGLAPIVTPLGEMLMVTTAETQLASG
jgi:cobalt-zinc-cadmium resistance protein CzcA